LGKPARNDFFLKKSLILSYIEINMGLLFIAFVIVWFICAIIGLSAYYSDEEVNGRKQNAQKQKDLMDYEDQKALEKYVCKQGNIWSDPKWKDAS